MELVLYPFLKDVPWEGREEDAGTGSQGLSGLGRYPGRPGDVPSIPRKGNLYFPNIFINIKQ